MVALHPSNDHKPSLERLAGIGRYAMVAVEVRAEPCYQRRGWHGYHGGRVGHGGGGGAVTPDLAEKEAKGHVVRMVLASGAANVVRMVWGGGTANVVSISESVQT
jgi:hypothetical protein